MKNLSKLGLISQSWGIVKRNVKIIALLILAYVVYQIVSSVVTGLFGESPLASLISLAFTLGSIFLQVGFIKIVLNLVDGKEARIEQLWAYPEYFLRAVAVTIVTALAILAGFILLIIPGIYLALRLQFALYYLVDKDKGVMDSIKQSWEVTRGNVINLFLFMLLLVILNIGGALLLLVGLLVTIPISFVSVALLYRKLQS